MGTAKHLTQAERATIIRQRLAVLLPKGLGRQLRVAADELRVVLGETPSNGWDGTLVGVEYDECRGIERAVYDLLASCLFEGDPRGD
jgi:hypothetical protein